MNYQLKKTIHLDMILTLFIQIMIFFFYTKPIVLTGNENQIKGNEKGHKGERRDL